MDAAAAAAGYRCSETGERDGRAIKEGALTCNTVSLPCI